MNSQTESVIEGLGRLLAGCNFVPDRARIGKAINELHRLSAYEPSQAQIDEDACELWFSKKYPNRTEICFSDKAGWLAALAWERSHASAREEGK